MDDDETKREHTWDYFQFHAQQRLTTFNFFMILSSLLIGGMVTTFQKEFRVPALGAGVGVLLMLMSFVFWKLDARNKVLIKNAEDGLRDLEAQSVGSAGSLEAPPKYAVFLQDAAYVTRAKQRRSRLFWKNHFSFSDCFNAVYASVAITGLLGALAAVIWQ